MERILIKTECLNYYNIFYTIKNVSEFHKICPYCKSDNYNDILDSEYIIIKMEVI